MPRSRRGTRSTRSQLSKQQPFSRVLFGLNIPVVGWVTARILARHFGDVDQLLARPGGVQEVEGIGPDRAEAIAGWFADEQNRTLVAELRSSAPFEVGEEEKPVEGPLTGSQYVITGTLESFSREEAKTALEALGAKVSDTSPGRRPASSSARAPARRPRRPRRRACRSPGRGRPEGSLVKDAPTDGRAAGEQPPAAATALSAAAANDGLRDVGEVLRNHRGGRLEERARAVGIDRRARRRSRRTSRSAAARRTR